MALRSSLVTATSPKSIINNATIKMSEKVSDNAAIVNAKSYNYVDRGILPRYEQLNKRFKALATSFTNCKKYVAGSKINKSLGKLSTNCSNQGGYCLKRKKEIKTLFKFASMDSKIRELEEALASVEKETGSKN